MPFYSSLKSVLLRIISKNLLKKYEHIFRYFYSIIYIGKNVECNVCKTKFSHFAKFNNTLICPRCGSSSRERRIIQIVDENHKNGKLLDFSPPKSQMKYFKEKFKQNYLSTDYLNEFEADFHFDITNINLPENEIQTIICYHILEHIEYDFSAMKELFRILSPNGKIFIQTPFKEGEIYENENIIQPEERKLHFGQADHVRVYSINGLKNRLEKVGFAVEILSFTNQNEENYFGLLENETILVGRKSKETLFLQ